jgi:hypothetical protein
MRRAVLMTLVGMGAALAVGPALQAQPPSPWLHVRVEEARGAKVSVNLPLSVVEVALKAAPETVIGDEKIHLGLKGRDLRLADFRKMWQELKASGDVDLVQAEDGDEKVTVTKKADLLLVRVEKAGGREEVHVEVPAEVVDALFASEGETLNVRGALAKLQTRRGDIVRVNDKDSAVRIWIDESAAGQGR